MSWNRSPEDQAQINQQEDRAAAQRSEINDRKNYNAAVESAHQAESVRWGSDPDDRYEGSSEPPPVSALETLVVFVILAIVGGAIWYFWF